VKRLATISVIGLHAFLLWCLLSVVRSSGPGGNVLQPASATASNTAADGPAAEEAGSPAARAGDRLDRMTFRRASNPLPSELARRTAECRNGVLIDWDKRKILWRKDANRPVPIASLTKMMTMLLLMETVRDDPGVTLDSRVRVTREAAAVGGSQVYLDPRETFTLEELLKCVAIFSANDAAHLIAQYLGGGDAARFVERMNRRARELGLNQMHFYTPSGLPPRTGGVENRGTAMEAAFLAARLSRYPEVVKWTSTWLAWIREKSSKPFQLVNRNRLIKECPGVVGMKTGFTQKAGFCVAAVCRRNDRVLIAVVLGCPSQKIRNRLVRDLLNWGYAAEDARFRSRTAGASVSTGQ